MIFDDLPDDICQHIRGFLLPTTYLLLSKKPEEWGHQACMQSLSRVVRIHPFFERRKKIHNFYFVHTMPRLSTRLQRCRLPDSFLIQKLMLTPSLRQKDGNKIT
jgi:hypothetical protein